MAKYRSHLPQHSGGIFLTDSGLETTLIFHQQMELPYFAAFDLLRTQSGKDVLRKYFQEHAMIARRDGAGFILESPTWRASADWGDKLGYSRAALAAANRESIALMVELRDELESPRMPVVISGCVGPRGDGYDPGAIMSPDEAQAYHFEQVGVFARTEADMVTAITMTNANEAIGVARAAVEARMPVVISFTVETDGRLPTGQGLADAITEVDIATQSAPAYYMINCAHPTHFADALRGGDWTARLRGLRANASCRSHAELDQATDLDDGDPVALADAYRELMRRFPRINVLGGCCATDLRHIEQISTACRLAA
jgi:S-methylmethionine-dependent homocysteine/selenocysteine methylase